MKTETAKGKSSSLILALREGAESTAKRELRWGDFSDREPREVIDSTLGQVARRKSRNQARSVVDEVEVCSQMPED